ncbi:MAG: metallophosphoesterase [Pseudomonadota bacterium]
MTRIVHASDIHVGTVEDGRLAVLADEINALSPDLTIISGDLTQWADRDEFVRAAHFRGLIDGPVLIVPGNHDIDPHNMYRRFFEPYKRYQEHLSADLEPTCQTDTLSVLGLNSAIRWQAHWNWSHGRVTLDQVRRIAPFFEAATDDALKILFLHHPVLRVAGVTATRPVRRAGLLLAAAAGAKVDLILTGHSHRFGVSSHLGAGNHALLVVAAGSAVSPRERDGGNSLNLIVHEDQRLSIRQRVLTGSQFFDGALHVFEKGEKGGWYSAG